MAVTVTIDYDRALDAAAIGHAMRRASWPALQYLRAHNVQSPFPTTLPSEHGETITLYEPTTADKTATDWRRHP